MIKICQCDRPMIRKLCGEGPLSFYAETVGFAFWKTIRTGKAFETLSPGEALAVLAHEEGHIWHWHIEKRMLWMLCGLAFLFPQKFFAMCARQELEADDYARAKGHRFGLLNFLCGLPNAPMDGYPPLHERIARLANHG